MRTAGSGVTVRRRPTAAIQGALRQAGRTSSGLYPARTGCSRLSTVATAEAKVAVRSTARGLADAESAVLFIATGVLLTALLPGTPVFRAGVVLSALLLFAYAALWFHVLPPSLFGRAHFSFGVAVTVAIAAVLLELTGGVESPYFPVYLLSVLGSVFAVRPGVSLATGVAAILAYLIVLGEDVVTEEIETSHALDHAAIGLLGLGAATLVAVGIARSLRRTTDALRQRSEELAALATTDPLTGLRNRAVLDEQLARMQALAERSGRPYALAALDLDNLKELNDGSGHEAGDRALVAVADAIRGTIRGSDIGVRIGGDEFLILLPETGPEEAERVGRRLTKALRAAQPAGDRQPVSLSAGIAAWRPGRGSGAVRAAADAMLYQAKAGARGRTLIEPSLEPSDDATVGHA